MFTSMHPTKFVIILVIMLIMIFAIMLIIMFFCFLTFSLEALTILHAYSLITAGSHTVDVMFIVHTIVNIDMPGITLTC